MFFYYNLRFYETRGGILDVIYFLIAVSLVMFIFGFSKREYTFSMLSAILIMCLGIYVLGNGLGGVSDWIVQTFGTIYVAFGLYIVIRASTELLGESLGDWPFNRLRKWIKKRRNKNVKKVS